MKKSQSLGFFSQGSASRWSLLSAEERENSFPQCPGCVPVSTSQGAVGHLCRQGTPLAHVQLVSSKAFRSLPLARALAAVLPGQGWHWLCLCLWILWTSDKYSYYYELAEIMHLVLFLKRLRKKKSSFKKIQMNQQSLLPVLENWIAVTSCFFSVVS